MPTPSGSNVFLAAALIALAGCARPSGSPQLEGAAISKVIFRHIGPKSVEEERLRNHIRTTAGSRYDSERTDDDIKALYESGLVNDVRVLAEPKRGGVEVIFEVRTASVGGPGIGFIGNTAFSDQRLAKEAGFRAGKEPSRPALITAARRIEAFYHANGYPNAKVTTRFDVPAPIIPPFVFFVEEGVSANR